MEVGLGHTVGFACKSAVVVDDTVGLAVVDDTVGLLVVDDTVGFVYRVEERTVDVYVEIEEGNV